MILVLNSKLPKLFLVNFGAYIINFFLINIYNRIYLPFKKRGERSFLYAVFDFIYDLNWKNVIKSSQNKLGILCYKINGIILILSFTSIHCFHTFHITEK